jgi:hypothetical protein
MNMVHLGSEAPATFGDRKMRWSLSRIERRLWGSKVAPPDYIPAPPPDWIAWQEPKKPIPIDDFVTGLIQGKVRGRNRIMKVRDAQAFGDHCPYEIARRSTVYALSRACSEQRKAEAVAKTIRSPLSAASERMRNLDKFAGVAAEYATDIAHVAKLASLRVAHNKMLEPDFSGLRASMRVAELLEELDQHLPSAKAEVTELHLTLSQEVKNAEDAQNAWRVEFVSRLGDTWIWLVGEKPTAQGAFAEFIEAAWNSLEEPAPREWRWESSIRTAIKRKGEVWQVQTHPLPK